MMEYLQILGQEVYKIMFLIIPILVSVAMIVWLDRRVWGLVQKRRGPNVVGPFGLFQTLADALKYIFKEIIKYKRSNKIKSRLRFINIASRAAFRGEQQDYISYACSKGGIISLTKTMSRSFGESDNVVAISIAPGFVRTEMAQSFIDKHGEDSVKQGITLDRLTEPKDISPIVSLIVSGKMDHSTGSTIDVNGGSFLR